jgi:hypothetical protein
MDSAISIETVGRLTQGPRRSAGPSKEGAGEEEGEEWTMKAFLSAHYALDAKK